MVKTLMAFLSILMMSHSIAQPSKTELYDLLTKFATDSTGYENVGAWSVGNPKKFPVAWKTDRLEMSEDTSINFFRIGSADILVKGKTFMHNSHPAKWTVMLKGPRMGYTSFSIMSSPASSIPPRPNLDSVFAIKEFQAKLIKSCDNKNISGFHFYEVKIPRKDLIFLKLSWITINGNTAWRIDGYDIWSKSSAKLACQN